MVLAAPGQLLTPSPSSSPPKTPHRSSSAQIRSQNEEKKHPPQTVPHVSMCVPMHTSCSSSRMHELCAAVTTSFVQGTLPPECGQLSPSAALRSSCIQTPHAPSDTTCTPSFFFTHNFASAVHKEMCQSPPEAIFSAVDMLWTWFLTISQFLLNSILPGGDSPYSH